MYGVYISVKIGKEICLSSIHVDELVLFNMFNDQMN